MRTIGIDLAVAAAHRAIVAGPDGKFLTPVLKFHARREEIEGLVAFLGERVEEGEFLLAYEKIPLWHYLTRTRPALDTSMISRRAPGEKEARRSQLALWASSVAQMIERGRVPRFAIRTPKQASSVKEADDPVHAFVARYFRRVAQFGRFEVWKRTADIAPGEIP